MTLPEEDGDIEVQCGVRWEQINDFLDKEGVPLFWPVSGKLSPFKVISLNQCCPRRSILDQALPSVEWSVQVVPAPMLFDTAQ